MADERWACAVDAWLLPVRILCASEHSLVRLLSPKQHGWAPRAATAPYVPGTSGRRHTTYGTGVGGDRSIEVRGEGQIAGKMEVALTAASELITLVGEARRGGATAGRMNINGPSSRGVSSRTPRQASGAPAGNLNDGRR